MVKIWDILFLIVLELTFLYIALQVAVGGKTQLTSMISVGILFVVIYVAGPLFECLPKVGTQCVRDLDWTNHEDFLTHFWPLLKQAVLLEAAGQKLARAWKQTTITKLRLSKSLIRALLDFFRSKKLISSFYSFFLSLQLWLSVHKTEKC